MSYIRSSPHYIWNTSSVLGKGATGAVYSGLNKTTGEPVAVKSFNHLSHMRPYEVQKREFEVLKKVNHENIVKLLDIEEENESHQKVLIMELCTGGSLFSILDDPINCHGLEEKEFVLVLKHLAAGMKHLRDNNIIHRDLKPGNIMKFMSENGQSIYKLTDFGAARELGEDQQFMSLYGTEEYLHPDMYERAVLRKPAGKSFKANVDLWSIGVTLYHIATGSLPFRPFGGRKNKETMFKITTEKQSGMISGYQHTEDGEIEWSKNLPKTCLLSPALQSLITPLFAGLMECDATRMWSFEKFFNCVTHVLNHKIYHIFFVNHMKEIIFYLLPSDSIKDIRNKLEASTGVAVTSQLLLFNKQQIFELENITTEESNPIILLNSHSTKMKPSPIMSSNSPKFPDMQVNNTNCDQDAQLAKMCSSMAYCIQRLVNKCVQYYRLANDTPQHVVSLIDTNVKLLNEKQQACSYLFTSLQNQLTYLSDVYDFLKKNISSNVSETKQMNSMECVKQSRSQLNKLSETWSDLTSQMTNMSNKLNELNDIWLKEEYMNDDIEENIINLKNKLNNLNETEKFSNIHNISSASARAKYICQKIRESWQALYKDKNSRVLSVNEDQLHQLEKIKIQNNCKKISDLLNVSCHASLNLITEKLEDWYARAQVAIVVSQCLFRELSDFMSNCEELQHSINLMKEDQKKLWKEIINSKNSDDKNNNCNDTQITTESQNNHKNSLLNSSISGRVKKELRSLQNAMKNLHGAVDENQSLTSEFESLSLQK